MIGAELSPGHYVEARELAGEIDPDLSPERAAIRLQALVDAVKLGDSPRPNLMMIASIALVAVLRHDRAEIAAAGAELPVG